MLIASLPIYENYAQISVQRYLAPDTKRGKAIVTFGKRSFFRDPIKPYVKNASSPI
jgi:hypothetical protein